ncbi:MAG: chitobiase/beta-hexosaminidase C-terminal domain-containing protein [Nakamurella sp.]
MPEDQGGPGAGQPIGGFGGNPAADREAHRAVVAELGKAPVILVHGNGGAADVSPWDLLDQHRFLLAAGYADELIWAPSYLGSGTVDLLTPHTNNIDDVRTYLEAVCEYLDVDVVDVIAHSLGCTLMYALFRGLGRQANPISWDQPKKWSRVGTLVSLAGAFHGLGTGSVGEWQTGGEFMNELLQETEGGGGETPFATGKPQTPPPLPHTISYFCGTASGDFVDAQNPGTGRLDGATNRDYNLGSGTQGHQAIKENQAVFDDFLPLLNSVPPRPAVQVTLDPAAGQYPSPLTITFRIDPPNSTVSVTSSRLLKSFQAGYIIDQIGETTTAQVADGQAITLTNVGRWEVAVPVAGQTRTYWVGVLASTASIVTDNTEPFDTTLLVTGRATDPTATLYYSLDYPTANSTWNVGAAVTITVDSTVSFIAINPQGVASDIVSRSFTKRVPWDDAVTADAISHYLAGRIDVTEYLAYSDQFGFFTAFTLYLIGGEWVLDPNQVEATAATEAVGTSSAPAAEPPAGPPTGPPAGRLLVRIAADSPQPGRHPLGEQDSPFVIVIEGVSADQWVADHRRGDQQADSVTVYYTRDGSIPTTASPAFNGAGGRASARFEFTEPGNHVIACYATDSRGSTDYRAFAYTLVTPVSR